MKIKICLLAACLVAGLASAANAYPYHHYGWYGGPRFTFGIYAPPIYIGGPPVYAAPPPVYVAPPPVYARRRRCLRCAGPRLRSTRAGIRLAGPGLCGATPPAYYRPY